MDVLFSSATCLDSARNGLIGYNRGNDLMPLEGDGSTSFTSISMVDITESSANSFVRSASALGHYPSNGVVLRTDGMLKPPSTQNAIGLENRHGGSTTSGISLNVPSSGGVTPDRKFSDSSSVEWL